MPAGVSRGLVALLALTCGAAVANLYYVQPLLNLFTHALGVSQSAAGLLVTCSQLGYVLGLGLVVPLGDLLERRRLITGVLVGAAVAGAACAAAPSFSVLAAALVALGGLSVVAQIVVPLAATLASPQRRGQVVGTVMSGLLIGILLSRTLSGLIAALGGWRLVFALAAAAMLVLSLALRRGLPIVAASPRLRYPQLLRSVFSLITHEPVLRQRMALGALAMADSLYCGPRCPPARWRALPLQRSHHWPVRARRADGLALRTAGGAPGRPWIRPVCAGRSVIRHARELGDARSRPFLAARARRGSAHLGPGHSEPSHQ